MLCSADKEKSRLTWYRDWFGEEYLDLYSYRDEEEARQHVSFFKSRIGSVQGPILDLACGSGRHMQEFATLGYRIVGCDLSHTLLSAAREADDSARVARADMRLLPFEDQSFGGLVNFFTSFGYFETEDDNLEVAREMCRVLVKGAPFLFDYLNVHRELSQLVRREERTIENGTVLIERWFDGASRTFNKRIRMAGQTFLERVRGYDLDEISTLFASAGLAIAGIHGDFHGAEFNEASPRLIIVGTRRR